MREARKERIYFAFFAWEKFLSHKSQTFSSEDAKTKRAKRNEQRKYIKKNVNAISVSGKWNENRRFSSRSASNFIYLFARTFSFCYFYYNLVAFICTGIVFLSRWFLNDEMLVKSCCWKRKANVISDDVNE